MGFVLYQTLIARLLILHEDKVEGTIEECVDEVCEAEVEYEQVGDGPHPSVICNGTKIKKFKTIPENLRMTIQRTAVLPPTAVMIMKVKATFQKWTKESTMRSLSILLGHWTTACWSWG